jgi:hypothetical protein
MGVHPEVRGALLVLVAAVAAGVCDGPVGAQDRPPQCAAEDQGTLEGRNCAFLRAGGQRTAFLPRTGTFRYSLTSHYPGRMVAGTWLFSAADVVRAAGADGPLRGVFALQVESQPVGRLAHQVLHRGTVWRRVGGNRFVPPGASGSSPVFVEWRREGSTWVVSAVGDEAFADVPLPSWCC